MTTEDEETLPATQPSATDAVVSAGLEIAIKWGAALGGPEKLDIALKALEPQLRRDHKERLLRLEMQREAAEATARATRLTAELAAREQRQAAVRASQERREERAHRRHMTGLIAGAVIAVAMLGAGVHVAKDAWWLATLLCGPSLLALAKVFVLRRSDSGDMDAVSRASRTSTNAATQAQPPAPPVV